MGRRRSNVGTGPATAWIQVLFLATLLPGAVTADKTNLAIINLTPYEWTRAGNPHSYQMVHWEDNLPAELGAGASKAALIQIKTGITIKEEDDAGEFYWSVDNGLDNTIELGLDVSGDFPDYTISLHAKLEGIKTMNNPSGSSVDIDFIDDSNGWTPFILAGEKGSFVGNNPPSDWMHQNLPYLGCLNLQQMVIPGTHDSGMSKVQYSTAFSTAANTQTQKLDILGQLNAGARYFDIRPVISHGKFYTGHYGYVCVDVVCKWQGSVGQSIAEVIDDVNEFTSKNAELVILYLSHTHDTDTDYTAFSDDATLDVLSQLRDGLKHLWTGTPTKPLTAVPLSSFISSGPAVLVVVDEREKPFLDKNGYTGDGFFASSASFPKYDNYSNTDSLDTMRATQHDQLVAQSKTPDDDDQLFLLSWTLTQSPRAATLSIGDGIVARAAGANARLAEIPAPGAPAPDRSPFLWGKSMSELPNIVLVDNFSDNRHLTALALAFSRFYSNCSHT